MAVSDKIGFGMFDIIVIGAGIEGSATAYYLTSKFNKKVLLLEQVNELSLSLSHVCIFILIVSV